MNEDTAIKVEHVSKDFILPHENVNSIKALFTSATKKTPLKGSETQHALNDISFEIKKGEFFGIVGRNGSGKSTMLKILAGIYQPTKGSVKTTGKLVPFIELGVGFNPELTGRENVYLNGAMLGFSCKEVEGMYEDIVAFAEIEKFMDQKLKNYSSGMQVRLAFSMATRAEAEILLVDEVLAVGDADFQRKCFDYFRKLKKDKKTVIFVTHDMTAVREYCDRAILIEKSKVVLSGKPSKVATAYTRMFSDEAKKDTVIATKNLSRWGDEAITYNSVYLSNEVLSDSDNELIIKLTARANKDVENPIFGFSIKGPNGVQILGTNSQIRKKSIPLLRKDQTITIEWTVPNVFTEGFHFVEPAIVYHDGTVVSDWWEEAKTFNVVREERTPYVISPPIAVRISAPVSDNEKD